MELIALSPERLRQGEPLPFCLRDLNGLLLLPAGGSITTGQMMQTMRNKALFVSRDEEGALRRWLDGTVEGLVRSDAPLQHITHVRLNTRHAAAPGPDHHSQGLAERFTSQMQEMHQVLQAPRPDGEWLERLHKACTGVLDIGRRQPDALLFLLIQHVLQDTTRHSAHQAVLCASSAELMARLMHWSDEDIDTLAHAALTMNLSITALQDAQARQPSPLSPEQRQALDEHARQSSVLLAAAGVKDARWLKAVRLHHDPALAEGPLASLDIGRRMARIIETADRYVTMIGLRRDRPALSPLLAARQVCVGPDGQPDEVGAALIRALGMYPPGMHVRLANQEVGVVLGRGERSNEPQVAVLVGAGGMPLSDPVLRRATGPRAVIAVVPAPEMRVRLQRQRLLDLL
ncbi:hypothetical protein C7444_105262 [Sphaerotilus hippei]|uniref:HD domain-containing protein n=1 Tax=Sphaerotilus hippei TaxID=744406 RepID=A0A318H288_9BURK|nr:hypothetical protein [Sphaerotilus hippei]PXW97162.1 hypothetical protein C7444_105262 [Sphaerotilus hippei]